MQCGVVWAVSGQLVSLNLAGELCYLDPSSPGAPVRVVCGPVGPVGPVAAVPGGSLDFFTGGDDGCVFKWAGGSAAKAVSLSASSGAMRTTHAGKVVGVFPGAAAVVTAGFDDKVT